MIALSFGPLPTLPEVTDGGLADITGGVETTDGALLAEHTDGVGVVFGGQGGSAPPQRPPVVAGENAPRSALLPVPDGKKVPEGRMRGSRHGQPAGDS